MTEAVLLIASPLPAKLLSINSERKGHWGTRAQIVRAWRECAWAEALSQGIPRFSTVEIDVQITQKGILADIGNHLPTVKAIIDGLVDAKVMPDDNPTYLRALRIHPNVRGEPQVRLSLVGETS